MKLSSRMLSGMLVTMVAGASIVGAQAVTSTGFGAGNGPKQPLNWERRIDGLKLIDEANYDAWKQFMMDNGRDMIGEKVTAEEFAKMAEMYDAIKAGNYDRAKEISKGLQVPGMGWRGKHLQNGQNRPPVNEAPFFQTLSPEVQEQLKAAHEAGDFDRVQQILKDNNVQPPQGRGRGLKNGQRAFQTAE